MIQQIKINNNLISYKGDINYTVTDYEHIEHEGKTYTHRKVIDKQTTVQELKDKNGSAFYNQEYDFDLINYKVNIEDCSYFLRRLSDMTMCQYSENDYVNAIVMAFNNGYLDKRIKNVYNTKTRGYYPLYYKEDFSWFLQSLEVVIPLFSYGFNNSVYYTIHIKDLLKADVEKIPEDVLRMFAYYNIDLKKGATLNNVTKIFKLKINEASK